MAKEQIDFLSEVQDINNVNLSDISIPFLRILQQLSPQCVKNTDEYIQGAEAGKFINSVTGRIYGDSIKVVPLVYEKVWLEWKPNRGGFVAKHLPESIKVDKSDYSEWKTPDGNIVQETMNYYCFLPDFPEDNIVILSITSSGLKYARSWNTQIVTTRLDNGAKAPFFSSVWELSTKFNKNDQGSWYTIGIASSPSIKRLRFITKEEYDTYVKTMLLDSKDISNKLDYSQAETKLLPGSATAVSSEEVEY